MTRFMSISILSAFLIVACKSSDKASTSATIGDQLGAELYLGQLVADNKEIGWVIQDDLGFSVVGITESPGELDFTEVYSALSDGTELSITVDKNGLPSSLRLNDDTTVTFSNVTSKAYDIAIANPDGTSIELQGLDFSEYLQSPATLNLDGRANWDKFVGALAITLRVAMCPISVASTGGTLGASAVWAAASCTLAGKTLAQILSGSMEINATDQVPRFIISKVCDPEVLKDPNADNLGPCLSQLVQNRDQAFVVVSTAVDDSKPIDGQRLIYRGQLILDSITVDGQAQDRPMVPASEFGLVITQFGNEFRFSEEQIKALEALSGQGGLTHRSTEQKKLGERSYQVKVSFNFAQQVGSTIDYIQTFTLSEDLKTVTGGLGQHTTFNVPDLNRTTVTIMTYSFSGVLQAE